MTSFPRIERYGAICRPDAGVVYAGRRAVRISWWNSTEPQNPPVKIIVASADAHSSRVGDDWSRKRNPLNASGSSFSGTRDTRRILNLFGPFQAARRFFCTLRQLRQEARGVLSVLFSPCLSGAVAHEQQHAQERLECLTNVLKEPTK